MLRKAIVLMLAAMLIFSLGACSDGSSDNSNSNKDVLKVSYPTWWETWFKDLEKDFETAHKNVDVELIPLQDDPETKQAMMMRSKETSPDVVVVDMYVLNSYVNAGYLHPMDGIVNKWGDWDLFEETIKRGVTSISDKKIYGVPFSTDVQGLWYNKKLFKEAGLDVPFAPKSWGDVLTAAKTLRDKGSDDVIPLFIYAMKANGEATTMRTFMVLYSGTGSDLYDYNQNKWVIDNKALTDTFQFIAKVFKDKLGPGLSVLSNSQVSTLLAEDYMINGKVAMVMDGNWVAANWREGRNKPWPEALDTWGFIPFPTQYGQDPGYTSMSGGWALSIAANAHEKELAAEFIKMAVDREHQFDYVKQSGDMTVRKDVAEDKGYLDQPLSVYREAKEILQYTHFRPADDNYPKISTHIQEVVESVASGNMTPEEAVKAYRNGMERIVGADKIVEK